MTAEIKLIGRIHRPGDIQAQPYKEPPSLGVRAKKTGRVLERTILVLAAALVVWMALEIGGWLWN
jgi:hypothetical protein